MRRFGDRLPHRARRQGLGGGRLTYNPQTNMMYMPLRNTCARMMATRTFPEDTPVGRNEARSPFYAIGPLTRVTTHARFWPDDAAGALRVGRTRPEALPMLPEARLRVRGHRRMRCLPEARTRT